MKLEFDEKEIEILLRALNTINLEFRGVTRELDIEHDDVKSLYEKVRNHAKIDREHSRKIDHFTEAYLDNLFWEQLSDRLAGRDIYNESPVSFPGSISEEQAKHLEKAKRKYDKEFYENGLANIKIRHIS